MDFSKGAFFKCCGFRNSFPQLKFPEVSFVGKSNVGKSSIINRIFNVKKLARTSSRPGKTATINFYSAGRGFLVDLPGYGFAKISKKEKQRWADLTYSYFFSKRLICLVVVVFDCRRILSELDKEMVGFLVKNGFNLIFVLNKIDKISKTSLNEVYRNYSLEFANYRLIKFSVKTMEGLQELKETILSFVL